MTGQVFTQCGQIARFSQRSEPGHILLAKTPFCHPAKTSGQLRVITQFRVRIERQMVSQQVDVMANQSPQTLPAYPGDATIVTFPEIAVMHQNGIGISRHRRIKQSLAGRHSGDNALHLAASFHLQAVWAIIPKLTGLQKLIQILHQCVAFH
ncbi:MAG: hypothetical protein ACD_10C00317G0001 [uncultured bacterium]|nr:MAG: hypothetical protein ACD_10C00317G0001 [uncultured bacterium]